MQLSLVTDPPWPWPLLLASMVVVFFAGIVRGFSGFGFSALCVAALSLFLPPAKVVPPVLILEIVASVSLLRRAWPEVGWGWMAWLALGNALCIPLGVAVLAWVSEMPVRLLIGALLLCAALALRSGVRLALRPSALVGLLAGVVSGFFNGVAAIGGMAVAVLFSAAHLPPVQMRATMIVFLLFVDLYSLAWAAAFSFGTQAVAPLVGAQTWQWAMWLLPATLLGIWVGQRSFAGVSPQAFRRHVLNLLALIATLTVLRALFGLWYTA